MSGSPVPLDELLAHREWVRRLAWALTRDEHDAADLEQATWLAAMRTPPSHRTSLRGWLATTLRRGAGRLRRTRARRGAAESALADAASAAVDVAEVAARADLHRRVVEEVMALDEPYRGTVLLRFFDGLPVAEVAARTGVPLETCRARLRRGVERLRARFREGEHGFAALLVLAAEPRPQAAGAAGDAAMAAKTWLAAAAGLVLLAGATTTWLLARGTSATPGDAAAAAPSGRWRAGEDDATQRPGPPSPRPERARARAETSAAQPSAEVDVPRTAAAIEAKLREHRMSVEVGQTPLRVVLANVVSATGVEVRAPRATVPDPTVGSFRIDQASALSVLQTATKIRGWTMEVRSGGVVVWSRDGRAPADEDLVRIPRYEDLPQATVVFRVVDPDGNPVAGAEVVTDSWRELLGRTDAAGTVEVRRVPPLPPVVARSPGRVDSLPVHAKGDVAKTTECALTMGAPAGRVFGTVRDERGAPIEGATVTVWGGRTPRVFTTAHDGGFDDPSAPPTHVTLRVQARGRGWVLRRAEVRAGDAFRADVTLSPEALCEGVVRDTTGAPVADVEVTARENESGPSSSGVTGSDGRFRVFGLPAGRLRVVAVDRRTQKRVATELDFAAGQTTVWDPRFE